MSNKFTDGAALCLQKGFRVFPAHGKRPCIKGWKDKASNNPSEVLVFESDYPAANIAIATGKGSGIWVLDIDIKNGVDGIDSILESYPDAQFDDDDLIATTPSGGLHIYYKWDDDIPVTVAANVLSGIDIRGEGGLVIGPPSEIHTEDSYGKYEWKDVSKYPRIAPQWAVEIAKMSLASLNKEGKVEARSRQFDPIDIVQGVTAGNRDNSLFRYACHLRGCGVEFSLALGFIKEAAYRCSPPFPESEAVEKVLRAYEKIVEE